jgi:hypothetical protein
MISNCAYLALSSTERPEVTVPMTDEQFLDFCNCVDPGYLAYGTGYRLCRELLTQACERLAYANGRLKILEHSVDAQAIVDEYWAKEGAAQAGE